MIYRIDKKNFICHMIDHFTSDELIQMTYLIISAKVINGGTCKNVKKINELYPTTEVVNAYAEYEDDKILEKMYLDVLSPTNKSEGNYISNKIYTNIIQPLLNHEDVVLICDEKENPYLDVLCKFLDKKFSIEVIDLNKLFTEGHIGAIYIDRKEISDKAVPICRQALKDMYHSLESTRDGREKILARMSRKDKLRKLKELGIKVTSADKNLDKLLVDAWVNDEDDDDEDYKEWD